MNPSFAALLVSIVPHATPTAPLVQTPPREDRVVARWSVPVQSAFVQTDERMTRCDLRISSGSLVELAFQDVSADRPEPSLEQATWLATDVFGLSVIGAVDVVELPGGDLLAGFTAIVGASHRLALVRVRTERLPDGRIVGHVVATESFVAVDALVPTEAAEPRSQQADLFDGAAILVAPSGVSAFVGAHLPGRTVSKLDSVVVQIALDKSLRSIGRARVVADGSDPRVSATADGFVLGVRRPRDGQEVATSSLMTLLDSSDGSTWVPRADSPESPRVRWDYALAIAGRDVRISTPTDDPLVGVTWSLIRGGGEWRLEDTFVLGIDESPGQGVRIWSPRTRVGESGSGRVIVRSRVGLVRR